MKIKLLNILLLFLLIIIILGALENIIANIIFKDLNKNIVFKTKDVEYTPGTGQVEVYRYVYLIENEKEYYGNYSLDRNNFSIHVGDTVSYRRNNLRNSIWLVKLNGKKIQNYYGPPEYFSAFCLLLIPLIMFVRPKIIKYLKHKENERVHKIINKK